MYPNVCVFNGIMMYNNYFFHFSTVVKDKTLHTRWFFEIIRDGTRSEIDWQVLKNMDILNILLVMFNSCNTKDRVNLQNI